MDLETARTLVYTMTHPGDPEPDEGDRFNESVWGRQDCMGRVRDRTFDAVIGIGGVSGEPASYEMTGKIQWVGIGPKRWPDSRPGSRGSIVTFDRYLWFGARGQSFQALAPRLAERILGVGRGTAMEFSREERLEVTQILSLAVAAPSSHPQPAGPPKVPALAAPDTSCGCEPLATCPQPPC
jgi:hypothetical protein